MVARGREDLGGRSEVTVKRCGVSFGGAEDVLKLVVVADAELQRY